MRRRRRKKKKVSRNGTIFNLAADMRSAAAALRGPIQSNSRFARPPALPPLFLSQAAAAAAAAKHTNETSHAKVFPSRTKRIMAMALGWSASATSAAAAAAATAFLKAEEGLRGDRGNFGKCSRGGVSRALLPAGCVSQPPLEKCARQERNAIGGGARSKTKSCSENASGALSGILKGKAAPYLVTPTFGIHILVGGGGGDAIMCNCGSRKNEDGRHRRNYLLLILSFLREFSRGKCPSQASSFTYSTPIAPMLSSCLFAGIPTFGRVLRREFSISTLNYGEEIMGRGESLLAVPRDLAAAFCVSFGCIYLTFD